MTHALLPNIFVKHGKLLAFAGILVMQSCSSPLMETNPENVTDRGPVKVICNAEKGNQGLKDFGGPVYVHVGLITDSSYSVKHWRYVKFKWGQTEKAAMATPEGKNKWSYTIPNIREFFGVKEGEQISKLAILFRSGNCIDTLCKVLRTEDRSDIFIPVAESEK